MKEKFTERDQARNLFFQTDLPQTEIAQQVGIGERTLSRWINEGQWRKLKKAAKHTPAHIVNNFQLQLIEMQETIMSRPKGQRFATEQEALIMARLVLCISRMKVQVTQANSIQILTNYLDLVTSTNPQIAIEAAQVANDFLTGKAKDGFHHYDFENDNGLFNDELEPAINIPPPLSLGEGAGVRQPQPANVSNPTETNTVNTPSPKTNFQPANNNVSPPWGCLQDTSAVPEGAFQPANQISSPLSACGEGPGVRSAEGTYLDWKGNGNVLDYSTNQIRKITSDEWNAFLRHGYTLTDMGNYQHLPDTAYDEEIKKTIAKTIEQREKIEQFKQSMKRDYAREKHHSRTRW